LTAYHGGRYKHQHPIQNIAHGLAGKNAQNIGKNCSGGQSQRQAADPADLQKQRLVLFGDALNEKQNSRNKKYNGYYHKGGFYNAGGGSKVAQYAAKQKKHTPYSVKKRSFHTAPDLFERFLSLYPILPFLTRGCSKKAGQWSKHLL